MRQIQIVDDVHQLAMNQRNDKSVNPVPVDYMDSTTPSKSGCVDFIYKSTKEMGGALFSPQADPEIPLWAKYFALNRRVKFLMLDTTGRDEFDVKWTLSGGLQINTSMQINWSEGGMWQTDPNDPPKWADSGFNVAKLIDPNGWNDFMFRCSTDGKVWNIDSLACNGQPFTTLPANNRGLPLKQTSWTAQRAHFQEQAEVMGAPAYTAKRYAKLQLVMSDSPIPLGWF